METSAVWPDTPEKLQTARDNYDRFVNLSTRYKDDASLRARLDDGDVSDSLAAIGINLPDGVEAKFVADTPKLIHFIMPPDPNVELSDEALNLSAGGKTASSVSSIGSAGTVACSTAASTVSSAGSAGCADPIARPS